MTEVMPQPRPAGNRPGAVASALEGGTAAMHRLIRPSLFATALAAASVGGIAAALAQPVPIPPPRVEAVRPPPPGANYLWRPGHWEWVNGAYQWAGGEWIVREPGWRRGEFVPGHWNRRGAEWVWVPGRFR
jgi:hypothetical protein